MCMFHHTYKQVVVQSFCVFPFSHCLSMAGLWPSCSMSTGCVVPLRGIEPFSATLAQDRLVECDQPGKNPLKYSATPGVEPGPWGLERTHIKICSLSHWASTTDFFIDHNHIFLRPRCRGPTSSWVLVGSAFVDASSGGRTAQSVWKLPAELGLKTHAGRVTETCPLGWTSIDFPQNFVLTLASCLKMKLAESAWHTEIGGWWLTYKESRWWDNLI